jgi:glycosyltransferase involved in cell wall biosynthesis/SAM-dependent methyltransferase
MRVAFYSPMPPSPSGIADYSAALADELKQLADVTAFARAEDAFDATRFDIALYQVGNNGCHAFVYEQALRHPGVVALHEANLHHLIADLTIRRGDWDAYVEECEYNGGEEARAFAVRVRKLEAGPDYEGVKMTRRLLESARGVVVHSRYMEREVRAAGYQGPVAVIPHGAWIPQGDRMAWRHKLGLDEATPLVGIFGHLKPYKRIPEALRAFARLARLVPEVKLILCGEEHPDFPLAPLIRSLGLSANVRLLGFTPIDDFVGYLSACDIVLNLRFPTVGESSGTLLRAMGLGKATLVSDLGAFQEFPEGVCLKVPVGAGEEDLIFEYLNLLISRPDVARALGERAREYVERECAWPAVARQYASFLEAAAAGNEWKPQPAADAAEPEPVAQPSTEPEPEPEPLEDPTPYLRTWAVDAPSLEYLETHETRLAKTLSIIPPGGPEDRVLEMGAYLQITPALKTRLGYGEVRGCYFGKLGRTDHRKTTSTAGERFACEVDHFDAEKDVFPYPDGHFSTVVCCELIEHLFEDPMHLMAEINRVLKPGGHVVLTTPNIIALRAISAVLQGYHPGFYHAYIKPASPGQEVEARHNREYAPREIHSLLVDSGFDVTLLETGEFRDAPHPELGWVVHLLEHYRLSTNLRGDGIYAVGRKTGPVKNRYPEWLYS